LAVADFFEVSVLANSPMVTVLLVSVTAVTATDLFEVSIILLTVSFTPLK
jgi:hypothetical protein